MIEQRDVFGAQASRIVRWIRSQFLIRGGEDRTDASRLQKQSTNTRYKQRLLGIF